MAAVKGGDRLTKVLETIGRKAGRGLRVNVGYLAEAKYQSTVHKPNQGGLSVAQVAFWDEFGTVHSPPRPSFRTMIAENSPQWGPQLGRALKAANYDGTAALTLMGDKMKRELQDSIRTGAWAPLSPTTLVLRKMQDDDPNLVVSGRTVGEAARRARDGEAGATGDRARPLQDQLVMVNAVNFEVKGA